MSNKVKRPQAGNKKINSRNDFELCYIRHQYFRKVTFNPTLEEMEPYHRIIGHFVDNTFYTYRPLFGIVGMEKDDIINIGKIHLVNFLGLFSLEQMPIKYKEFVEKFNIKYEDNPETEDLLSKNKANFTLFLRQRMEDLVRICRQKAKNIKGLPVEAFFSIYGPKKPNPKMDLKYNYQDYGYKKIDISVFKSIRKKALYKGIDSFKFNGNWYISVPIDHRILTLNDFASLNMDPYDNIHNMDPEKLMFHKEEVAEWEDEKEKFKLLPKEAKTDLIKSFIKKNKKNPSFAEEIETAKKMLKRLEV